MSHNTDPQKAVRRHPAPIIAITVALAIAALAAFLFISTKPAEEGDVSRIESQTPATAEGTTTPAVDQPAQTPAAPVQN